MTSKNLIAMKKLTPKQEKFANLYVELGNASEAYRQAYDVSEDATDNSVWVLASRELSKVKVRLRVNKIKSELAKDFEISREFIVMGLLDIINDSEDTFDLGKLKGLDKEESRRFFRMMNQTKNTDKLRALEQLAKMLGLNAPQEHKHEIRNIDVNIKRERD